MSKASKVSIMSNASQSWVDSFTEHVSDLIHRKQDSCLFCDREQPNTIDVLYYHENRNMWDVCTSRLPVVARRVLCSEAQSRRNHFPGKRTLFLKGGGDDDNGDGGE